MNFIEFSFYCSSSGNKDTWGAAALPEEIDGVPNGAFTAPVCGSSCVPGEFPVHIQWIKRLELEEVAVNNA
jgi:hypothetical protein